MNHRRVFAIAVWRRPLVAAVLLLSLRLLKLLLLAWMRMRMRMRMRRMRNALMCTQSPSVVVFMSRPERVVEGTAAATAATTVAIHFARPAGDESRTAVIFSDAHAPRFQGRAVGCCRCVPLLLITR